MKWISSLKVFYFLLHMIKDGFYHFIIIFVGWLTMQKLFKSISSSLSQGKSIPSEWLNIVSFHETTEQIGSFMHFVFCVPSFKAQGNFPVILLMKSKTKEIHIQTKIHTPLCSRDIKPGYHGVMYLNICTQKLKWN